MAHWPTIVTHPGASLEDLLEEWGMSQAERAERMGRPAKTINEIVKGKNPDLLPLQDQRPTVVHFLP